MKQKIAAIIFAVVLALIVLGTAKAGFVYLQWGLWQHQLGHTAQACVYWQKARKLYTQAGDWYGTGRSDGLMERYNCVAPPASAE